MTSLPPGAPIASLMLMLLGIPLSLGGVRCLSARKSASGGHKARQGAVSCVGTLPGEELPGGASATGMAGGGGVILSVGRYRLGGHDFDYSVGAFFLRIH